MEEGREGVFTRKPNFLSEEDYCITLLKARAEGVGWSTGGEWRSFAVATRGTAKLVDQRQREVPRSREDAAEPGDWERVVMPHLEGTVFAEAVRLGTQAEFSIEPDPGWGFVRVEDTEG